MPGDNIGKFKKAMDKEIESLTKRKTWTLVPRGNKKTIPGTWAFCIKRKPNRSLSKFKAHFCVRGDLQKKVNLAPDDTYSPAINWSTIKTMPVLTQKLNLSTIHLDFSNTFAQTEIEEGKEVYLEPPPRYHTATDEILKLNKSLYGQIEAPQMWYKKLCAGLIQRGLLPSKIDPCLFIGAKVCAAIYVDDVIFFARDSNDDNSLIQTLTNDGDEYNWEHTVEGDLHSFLGINIAQVEKKDKQGNKMKGWKFTQRGLIDKILRSTKMQDCNPKHTPTKTTNVLGTNQEGMRLKEEWIYRSIVGMLLYLAATSQPDLSFAVHQCVPFTHAPKSSHEQAILCICRYLQATKDDGLIYWPTKNLQVDCYCDPDLAGLYAVENPHDPVSVKARTGYVIMIAGCPVSWVSKFQGLIALSTLEAKYISLSTSLRELIPLKTLLHEVCSNFGLKDQIPFVTHSTVYKDNNGALRLATTQATTPRTKHIAIQYHWFRTHVEDKTINIKKVDTKVQIVDIFTKGLNRDNFERFRLLLCGW